MCTYSFEELPKLRDDYNAFSAYRLPQIRDSHAFQTSRFLGITHVHEQFFLLNRKMALWHLPLQTEDIGFFLLYNLFLIYIIFYTTIHTYNHNHIQHKDKKNIYAVSKWGVK